MPYQRKCTGGDGDEDDDDARCGGLLQVGRTLAVQSVYMHVTGARVSMRERIDTELGRLKRIEYTRKIVIMCTTRHSARGRGRGREGEKRTVGGWYAEDDVSEVPLAPQSSSSPSPASF